MSIRDTVYSVEMTDGCRTEAACAVGEHQGDVEQLAREIGDAVSESGFSPASMSAALDFLAAAAAVLRAGLFAMGRPQK